MKISHLLSPPRSPFALAGYSFVVYLLISLAWSLLGIPAKGSSSLVVLMFAGIGYFYGITHRTSLTYKGSLLTVVVCMLPLFIIRVTPSYIALIQTASTSELPTVLGLIALILLGILGLSVLFSTIALQWASKRGARMKNSVPRSS